MSSDAAFRFYRLPAQMTAETAESLTEALTQLSATQGGPLSLDASDVKHVSTSGVQILVALDKSATAAGSSCEITGNKDLFSHIFEEIGLGGLINILR